MDDIIILKIHQNLVKQKKRNETMCNTALKQIQTKKYAEQLTDDCYEKVINYGIAFYGKACKVKMSETVYATED